MVSPMPLARSVPSATTERMVPVSFGPAWVTPRWSGWGKRLLISV